MISLCGIELCQDFRVGINARQYLLHRRECVNRALDILVQACVVDYQSQISILLCDEEPWSTPFRRVILMCDYSAVEELLDDLLRFLLPAREFDVQWRCGTAFSCQALDEFSLKCTLCPWSCSASHQ